MPVIRNETLFGRVKEILTTPCYSPNQRYLSQYPPQEYVLLKYNRGKIHATTIHEDLEGEQRYSSLSKGKYKTYRCRFQLKCDGTR